MSFKNKLNKVLRKFKVELHGIGYLQSLSKGEFKKDEFSFFDIIFSPGEHITIFDVGANKGTMVSQFHEKFFNAKIYAFEPYKPFFDELRNKFSGFDSVKVENIGISDVDGELTFYINYGADTNSFLPSEKTGLNSDKMVKNRTQSIVSVKTISSYSNENKINRINILKLDIQGSELNALKGAEELLINKKIDIIFTESYFIQQYLNQPLFPEITEYLSRFGYVLQDIYHPIYGNNKLAWCDAIFVRKDLQVN